MDALIRLNQGLVSSTVDAVHRADLGAGTVLGADAGLGDDVGQARMVRGGGSGSHGLG
ncbi:hypothetical protein [Deinococcus hopiensis]|uniref:hypothetical protein n=1 Tax=Deinococcus hopiensis TaxID=309885 RepID=UPI003183242D